MRKYQSLLKGTIYTVIRGRRVRRYTYKRRYYNRVLNQWHYVFRSLDGFEEYTPKAEGTFVSLT